MDSMSGLNISLPRGMSPPKQQPAEPPEQLLQAFKAAALSVTKLYKTAAADQSKARAEGFQDALDDLLMYLDKESIGLNEGEGRKIRRWVTERLDGRDTTPMNPESDDDSDKAERASSPVLQRASSASNLSTARTTRAASPARPEPVAATTAPTHVAPSEEPNIEIIPPQGAFSFRSSHPYPQDTDILLSDLDLSDNKSHDGSVTSHASNPAAITITRPPRTNSRHSNHSTRIASRASNNIGRGAGQKRKINLGDFFDIGNLGKDTFGHGGGNPKRGRFV